MCSMKQCGIKIEGMGELDKKVWVEEKTEGWRERRQKNY